MEATAAVNSVAVLLIVKSRPGPKLVFQYPPSPRQLPQRLAAVAHDESGSDGEVDELQEAPLGRQTGSTAQSHELRVDRAGTDQQLDGVLGYSEDVLERMLSPENERGRKRFEIGIDGLTFVGHPIYTESDVSWARSGTKKLSGLKIDTDDAMHAQDQDTTYGESEDVHGQLGIKITEPKTPSKPSLDFAHPPESFDTLGDTSLAASMNSASTTSTMAVERLTMFHVVFALSSSGSECKQENTRRLYSHVAKKLSKALEHCQKQSGYVAHESKKMQVIKAKGRQSGLNSADICAQMIEGSELAWALKELFENISIGKIANIRLNRTDIALQCPPIPSVGEGRDVELGPHSAIMLLADRDVLLRDLKEAEAAPLIFYIRHQTPTKSLQKQAATFGMSMADIKYLSRHLVDWRRAKVISPLHPRNTYVVGQNAPLEKLPTLIPQYAQRFAALPNLPQMLKMLSGKPIKYGMLIPSRDHRTPYMEILAWLVRHSLVVQMRTCGWLRKVSGPKRFSHPPQPNRNKRPLSMISLLSPQLRPVEDDNMSMSSEKTAIPISTDPLKPHNGTSTNDMSGHSARSRLCIIVDPLDCSADDERSMSHVRESLSDPELSDRLPTLLHYFDGGTPFEEIAAREGLKRSKVDHWLDVLEENDFLMSYQHL